MNRRQFIKHASAIAAGTLVSPTLGSGLVRGPKAFFTLQKQKNRWWLITPSGRPFFSIGLNHVDAASLRYVENQHIWRDQYDNSMQTWRQQVRGDLLDWGFNTVGWVQEVVTRETENHRHSRNFTYIQNRVRRRGLRDGQNAVDLEGTDGIRKVNQETTRWAESIGK